MGSRITGEFSPPRELVALGASRMGGRGTVAVSAGGLAFEGTILGASPVVPMWASVAVLCIGVAFSSLVPHAERYLTPATGVIVSAIVWLRYRAEYGRTGVFRVPWSEVEHVVRLASAPDVMAFVFAHPIAGGRTPEQVFFSATEGIETLVRAVRDDAPPALTIDVESALLPQPVGSVDEPEPV